MYKMWKSVEADYYGLCHYRRLFRFDTPCFSTLEEYISKSDIMLFRKITFKESLYEQYTRCHPKEHIDIAIKYIQEKHPQMRQALKILDSKNGYMMSCFVMRRGLFFEYCEWIFDVLFAIIPQIPCHCYDDTYQERAPAFVAERLFNVWLAHKISNNPALKITPLKMMYFGDSTQPKKDIADYMLNTFGRSSYKKSKAARDHYLQDASLKARIKHYFRF